jgi:hypothetical protein
MSDARKRWETTDAVDELNTNACKVALSLDFQPSPSLARRRAAGASGSGR